MKFIIVLFLAVISAATAHAGKRVLPDITVEAIVAETFEPAGAERAAPGRFVIRRTGDTRHALIVRYVVGGSARNGHDYARLTGHAIIARGQSQTSVLVEPLRDKSIESDEKVILVLAAAAQYQVSSPEIAIVVIHPRSLALRPGDLLNINFGAGDKLGMAGIGKTTNDSWNLMGQAYNGDYSVNQMRRSDGSETAVAARLENSGGIWGNQSGDLMYDSYVYPNSIHGDGVGNMTLTLTGISEGACDIVLYGHGDHITPDNRPESDSVFTATVGGVTYGPAGTVASPLWHVSDGWTEGAQYVVLRNVIVDAAGPIVITIEPGYNGQAGTLGSWDRVAILNGLQLLKK